MHAEKPKKEGIATKLLELNLGLTIQKNKKTKINLGLS